MPSENGLVAAYRLDGKGGARSVDWEEIRAWSPGDGVLWIHGDVSEPAMRAWIENQSGLPALVAEALVEQETRPRSVAHDGTLLLNLRGVNLNPGADPEDMVSIRMWTDGTRLVSMRRRRLLAVDEVRRSLEEGVGPASVGDLVLALVEQLGDRIARVVGDLEDAVDVLEDESIAAQSYGQRSRLSGLRRQAIGLRRYLAPQREAMARLPIEPVPWLTDRERLHLREEADRTTRLIEDLDSARERATVVKEELDSRLAEQMNRTMYVLSIVAAIFLPLSFVTGLLGINVGGIPGSDSPRAFAAVCAGLIALAAGLLLYFRKIDWL